jgi:nucleoside-diphosphate-sugar epimerase
MDALRASVATPPARAARLSTPAARAPQLPRCAAAAATASAAAGPAPRPARRAAAASTASSASASAASPSAPAPGERLLVVGPGVLGSYLAKLWLAAAGPGTVVGQTNTEAAHARLAALGVAPRTKAAAAAGGGGRFANVAFCAPPSGSEDYAGEVRAALALWDGAGAFVFTSSAGLYAADDGSPCDEASPLVAVGAAERTDRLLAAEAAVRAAGGSIVRLAGLYHRARGAHTFFLKAGRLERWGGYTVNLLHYEDAAALALAALAARARGGTFLGCDGAPVTFENMMAAVARSGELAGEVMFVGAPGAPGAGGRGKLLSCAATREALGWAPKYPSFAQFFAAGARDWYFEHEAAPAGAPHAG